MATREALSISKFAKLSQTTRDTLHHYDKIGLLSPTARGENNYRYYSSGQLATANVIRVLQELGMSLAEIKELKDRRTPERMVELLARQMGRIDVKMEELGEARKFFSTLRETIHSVLNVDERSITVQSLPEEAIVLGEPNDYGGGGNMYDALLGFYRSVGERYLDMEAYYPVCGLFSRERVRRGEWGLPDRYYCCHPRGRDKRPAGRYAVGYARGGYGQSGELCGRLLAYIDGNGLEVCGDAYEEYPLNEVCIPDDKNYLIRVLIAVRGKGE